MKDNIGYVVQAVGPIIDVRFKDNELPELLTALEVKLPDKNVLVIEVAQHIGDDVVRCVAMGPTEGVLRGLEVIDTNSPICVPVGEATLGRMFNVLGNPIDGLKNDEKFETTVTLLKISSEACKKGVTRVHLVDGNLDGVLLTEIFSDFGSGTMIYTNNYGKIRPMQKSDIPSVLAVMRPFIENGKLLPRTQIDLAENLNDYIVYELDGGVHACSALHTYDDGQSEIAAVAVDESYNHMGIGPKLIEKLLSIAKEKKSKSVFIMTTQASDWFEKLGFVEDDIKSIPHERLSKWTVERNSKVFRLKMRS